MKRTHALSVLCLVLIFPAFLSAQDWADPDKTAPSGTTYATFFSPTVKSDVSYLVYLPPGYDTSAGRRYPVIYWLHGLNGDQRGGAKWFVPQLDAAIKSSLAPPAIAVIVNGLRDSRYVDSYDKKKPVETVIVKDLVAEIDKTYRTIASRDGRALEGYSMGGFGAARLGFKYPEVFGAVSIMAGALLDDESIKTRAELYEKNFGSNPEYFHANSPWTLVESNANAIRGRTFVRMGVGDQDSLLETDRKYHELLGRLKIEHEFFTVPGVAHDDKAFYDKAGPAGFSFYGRAFGQPAGAGPRMDTITPAASRVIQRGDLEILTFETEEDFEKLEVLYKESQQMSPQPGVMTTEYFRSGTDGSVEPYAIRLPGDFKPGRTYPLVIQLHGLNFNKIVSGRRAIFRSMSPAEWVHPDLPVILVQCFGRQSTFYQSLGEVEVLETIDEVTRRFPVDRDRVYIMGHSMGGAGSYTVGLHYPDRFGGIMPLDPAMGGQMRGQRGVEMPDWMKPQATATAVDKLYPNARNVDVFFKNAGAGIQKASTEMTDGIVALGGFSTTESFPGMPHNFADQYPYGNFIPELINRPIRRNPPEVKFYTNNLRYNRAYWVSIDRLSKNGDDALVVAKYDDGRPLPQPPGAPGQPVAPAQPRQPSVTVTTKNIEALTLNLAAATIPENTPMLLQVDGQSVLTGPMPNIAYLAKVSGSWRLSREAPKFAGKRPGLQGPIGDVISSKFLAVYGKGDRELAIAELDAIRNPPGVMTMHGDFPMKAAEKVTAADIASSNLILFGTPASNAVIRRIAARLPSKLVNSRGAFIMPNPENPDRCAVVWNEKILSLPDNALRAGYVMPVNLLPDWVEVKEGKIVAGGFFDNDWK